MHKWFKKLMVHNGKCRFCRVAPGNYHTDDCFLWFFRQASDFWDTRRDFDSAFQRGLMDPCDNPYVIGGMR